MLTNSSIDTEKCIQIKEYIWNFKYLILYLVNISELIPATRSKTHFWGIF